MRQPQSTAQCKVPRASTSANYHTTHSVTNDQPSREHRWRQRIKDERLQVGGQHGQQPAPESPDARAEPSTLTQQHSASTPSQALPLRAPHSRRGPPHSNFPRDFSRGGTTNLLSSVVDHDLKSAHKAAHSECSTHAEGAGLKGRRDRHRGDGEG